MTTRTMMRHQYHTVIDDWARDCEIRRFQSSVDATGRESGAFNVVEAAEPVWIQAVSRGDEAVVEKGLDSRTTHLAFQKWDGFALEPLDKIFDTDEQSNTHEYDVIRAHLKESHRVAELMLAKRNPN